MLGVTGKYLEIGNGCLERGENGGDFVMVNKWEGK